MKSNAETKPDLGGQVEMWRTKEGKEIGETFFPPLTTKPYFSTLDSPSSTITLIQGGTGIRNLLCTLHTVLWDGSPNPNSNQLRPLIQTIYANPQA